jgi:hypothetical protein
MLCLSFGVKWMNMLQFYLTTGFADAIIWQLLPSFVQNIESLCAALYAVPV